MDDPVNPFVSEPVASHADSGAPSPALSRTTSGTSSVLGSRSHNAASPPPTQRASFPDPSKEPRKGASRLAGPKPKEDFCCERDRQIVRGDEISIVDAFKTSDGGKTSYIAYSIRLGTNTVLRRYSAFLSLHQALQGLYPVLIIPPIPSKQNLADYAIKGQSKTKEDAATIATRKRLLEDFLRRVARHPILGGEHVFHRFLEDGVSWSEVMQSPPISLLPKNPLHAPSHNPTFQGMDDQETSSTSTPYIAHHLLPNPSPNHPLRRPDTRFQDSELFTDRFHQHFQSTMEKVNRRLTKRWEDRARDMSELGAQWNGFSLTESGALGNAVEKVGQAVDADYLATTKLLHSWEVNGTEPLHVYTQFSQLIRQRLSFRHQKQVQYELVQEALEHQRDKLELLESSERESRRLEDALERGGKPSSADDGSASASAEPSPSHPQGASPPLPESSPPVRPTPRRAPQSFGLLSAVKHSLSGMMDVDPEATRRANIGKTRDNISQLEDSLQASAQDLKYASTTLQADLDRFQRQKVADVRLMTIEIATLHREWCRQTLDAWKVAQAAIREIPDHPNKAPPEPPALQLGLEASLDRDLPPVPEHRRKSPAMPPIVSRSPPSDTDPLGSMPTSPFKSEPADPLDVEKHRTSPPVRNLSRTSSATAPVSAESLATSASAAAAATAPPAQSPPAVVSPPATSPPMSPPKAYTGNAKSDNEDDAAGPLGPL